MSKLGLDVPILHLEVLIHWYSDRMG